MMARMEEYALLRRVNAQNSMRERSKDFERVGTIRAAISAGSGGVQVINELMRVEATHTAVTQDDVRTGDRLRNGADGADACVYDVNYVIRASGRRMHQLFLKEVRAP